MPRTLLALMVLVATATVAPLHAQNPDAIDVLNSIRMQALGKGASPVVRFGREIPILGNFTKSDTGAFKYGVPLATIKAEDGSNQTVRFQAGISKISTRPSAGVEMVVRW